MGCAFDRMQHNQAFSGRDQHLWGPPRGFGNSGKRAFISGEQRNKGQILRGIGEQRQYWWYREQTKLKFSIFVEQGNKLIYFMWTSEHVSFNKKKILCKWKKFVSVRPSYFIFMVYRKKWGKISKATPTHTFIRMKPLFRKYWIRPWRYSQK